MAETENRNDKHNRPGEDYRRAQGRTYSSPSEEEYRQRELARRRRLRKERERRRERQIRRRKRMLAAAVLLIAVFTVLFVRGRSGAGEEALKAVNTQTGQQEPEEQSAEPAAAEGVQEPEEQDSEPAAAEQAQEPEEQSTEPAAAVEESLPETAVESTEEVQEEAPSQEADSQAQTEPIVFTDSGNVPDVGEEVTSEYAILVNIDKMEIVAGRNFYDMMYPASMTKVLTVLVAAEHVDLSVLDTDTFAMTQEILDVTYGAGASQVGWDVGDAPTVRDMFMGTILPSGGDAAMGLAVYTAGDVDRFMEMMNDKLAVLGLSDTAHFTNMTGLYDDNHYCTAYDMAVIMKAAIRNDLARAALSEKHYITTPVESNEDGYDISNWFLRRIEDKDTHGDVIAAKTGFVDESGNCAVSYQISDSGDRYICVTAGALSSWGAIYDHAAIYTTFTN